MTPGWQQSVVTGLLQEECADVMNSSEAVYRRVSATNVFTRLMLKKV